MQRCALIPYRNELRIPYDTMCRFHPRLRRDLVRKNEEKTMAKRNLLLEYSEELAIKIVKLCAEYKIDSNTVF